jgi:hypothetical protein
MSIDFSGVPTSVAGMPLVQRKGAEADRTVADVRAQERLESAQEKAEAAAGVGPADGEDHRAEGNADDGSLPWEETPQEERSPLPPDGPSSKDPLGKKGKLLDLSG